MREQNSKKMTREREDVRDDSRTDGFIPVGQQNKLVFKPRPGFYRRGVKNDPERIEMFKRAGYRIVTGDAQTTEQSLSPSQLGSAITADGGNGDKLILMEQPIERYNEHQKLKDKRISESEKSIFEQKDKEGFYGDVKRSHT